MALVETRNWTPQERAQWRKTMFVSHKEEPKQQPKPDALALKLEIQHDKTKWLENRVAELEQSLARERGESLSLRQKWARLQEDIPIDTPPRLEDIIREVAGYYGISVTDMRSGRRTLPIVGPRQVAMYLCRHLTLRSMPEIGRHFGGRDHTTVLHAVRKLEAKRLCDPTLCQEIVELEALFV